MDMPPPETPATHANKRYRYLESAFGRLGDRLAVPARPPRRTLTNGIVTSEYHVVRDVLVPRDATPSRHGERTAAKSAETGNSTKSTTCRCTPNADDPTRCRDAVQSPPR
eukprot:GHVU01164119.1.p1 GENE.GHVU01164119.1~~GHVU01164119.1.p1  ORF type:complete len:110 (-),score=3.76 GHVU01164119.1:16-345(-)